MYSSQVLFSHDIPRKHLPLLAPPLALLSAHGRLHRIPLTSIRRTQRRLLSQMQPDHILHTTPIMLNLPHIRQSRASRPLSRPLHNLDALDKRTVHFIPHLHADTRQLAAQQDRSVDAAPPDVDAHAGEGVAGALPHEQDVADARAFWVVSREEAGASAGGVEDGGLGLSDGCDGFGADFLDVLR